MKKITHLLYLLTLQSTIMAQTDVKLIYIADPMCSWCYGFSPELTKTLEALDPSLEMQMVMGGLRPYNDETMAQLGDFLKEHWEQVQDRSGQPFDYEILKDQTFVYDTEPACRAVVVMRQLKPEKVFDFFKAVQKAFYADNQNTNSVATYLPIAESFGVAADKFKAAFESDEMKKAARADFELANSLGVRGFPTLILQNGEQFTEVAYGYAEAEKVVKRIGNASGPKAVPE